MGIFDQIKKLKNYISGTGAQIHIEVDNSSIHTEGRVLVDILCQIKEHDLLIDKLYIKLKAEETVKYKAYNKNSHSSGTKTARTKTHNEEIIIDKNFRLEAMGEYEWQAEFHIPPSIPGTYIGVNARHEWSILAGLSKKGNDPDSGWVTFEV